TAEGSPYRGRAGYTALHGVRLSSVPSGGQSVTSVTSRVSPPVDSPLRGSLEHPPLQDSELVVQSTPEASLEWLVPLVDYLAAWKLLLNVSAWVLRTVEKGYSIQFAAPPPPFNG
ncbi:hypothetical protein M9458_015830, partial [Cirrhinus mrigala]